VPAGVGVARYDSAVSIGRRVSSSGEKVPAGVQGSVGVDGVVQVPVQMGEPTAVGETVAAGLVLRRRGDLASRCVGLLLPQMNADIEQHRHIRQYRPTRTTWNSNWETGRPPMLRTASFPVVLGWRDLGAV
jgi:hypothetical protein